MQPVQHCWPPLYSKSKKTPPLLQLPPPCRCIFVCSGRYLHCVPERNDACLLTLQLPVGPFRPLLKGLATISLLLLLMLLLLLLHHAACHAAWRARSGRSLHERCLLRRDHHALVGAWRVSSIHLLRLALPGALTHPAATRSLCRSSLRRNPARL